MVELEPNCDQSQIEEYFLQELAKACEILPKWDGGVAWVWQFDRELFTLTLRIEKQGIAGNLTMVCTTPLSHSGPFQWRNCEVRLTKDDASFWISDAKASFLLRAAVVDVYEDCDPLNAIFKAR